MMSLARGEWSFYTLRFLLGVAEAGFFPGIILYLTYWYPAECRARFLAAFAIAVPVSTVIGAPVSGLLLGLDGAMGLKGWQWRFVIDECANRLCHRDPLSVWHDRDDPVGAAFGCSARACPSRRRAAVAHGAGARRLQHYQRSRLDHGGADRCRDRRVLHLRCVLDAADSMALRHRSHRGDRADQLGSATLPASAGRI
jgi:hypothetical protein